MSNQSTPNNQQVGLTSVDYVVAEMLAELDDYSTNQKSRLTSFIISGLRDFRLYDQASIQVAYLTINESGIIPFPLDYVDYISIGIPRHGQLVDLGLDNKMLLNRAEECGVDTREMTRTVGNANGYGNIGFWGGSYGGSSYSPTFYGMQVGRSIGYYKIDKAAQRIQFDGTIPRGEIVLVYKSTGISPNTVIPAELIEPLKAWAHDKRIKYNQNVSMNQKMLMKQDLDQARSKLRAFTQKFTISEYLDVLYRHKKQTPKP